MIKQANEREAAYKSKLKQSISVVVDTDIIQFSQQLMSEFRDPNLLLDKVKHEIKFAEKLRTFKASKSEFDWMCRDIQSLVFEPKLEFQEVEFGSFRFKDSLIACTRKNDIEIWNINMSARVATLEGHTDRVICFENIDQNRFASGSCDKTIKIWDAHKLVCLKTLYTEHRLGATFLKSWSSNRLASGSQDGEINIWNIESGECLQTLTGHTSSIMGIICLPNGNLVSCSFDKTIKVWDLTRGESIQTLTGYSYFAVCIVLLRNGQLASGYEDGTIKIWNMESGECVHTLDGHSNYIVHLHQLDSGELVSCSNDETIKIWNVTEGICIRNITDHMESYIQSIRINYKDNTFVSCDILGAIRNWNLKTGECITNNCIYDENEYLTGITDFILI